MLFRSYYGKGYEDSDLRIPSMSLVNKQLDWSPKTTLKEAMESTMRVFIDKYADKLANKKRSADEAAPALVGVELDDEELRRKQMLDQLNQLVSKEPAKVASLLRRWMRSEA